MTDYLGLAIEESIERLRTVDPVDLPLTRRLQAELTMLQSTAAIIDGADVEPFRTRWIEALADFE